MQKSKGQETTAKAIAISAAATAKARETIAEAREITRHHQLGASAGASSMGAITLTMRKTLSPRKCNQAEKRQVSAGCTGCRRRQRRKAAELCVAFHVRKVCYMSHPSLEKHKVESLLLDEGVKGECAAL